MRNITGAKMLNLGAAIWRTISNIKLLCFPRCVPELLLSHLSKFIEFYLYAFKYYHKKCKLVSLYLAHPVQTTAMTMRPITGDLYSNISPKCPQTLTDTCWRRRLSTSSCGRQNVSVRTSLIQIWTRAHHRDEKPERDLTYHLTCLLIYHGTTTHL